MLSIVIPAYNEEKNIGTTVKAIAQELSGRDWAFEILVVNDGSADSTIAVLEQLEPRIPELRHVENPGPHGYGYAVRFGLTEFIGDAVVVAMADGSDAPSDMVVYYEKVMEGYDCAFGSRFIPGAIVDGYPLFKRVINRMGNAVIALLMGQRYGDFTNGFKCYRREVVERMQPLVSGQFNLTIEMSIKAVAQQARYTVVPTSWCDRDAGKSKFQVLRQVKLYLWTLLYCMVEVRVVPRIAVPARKSATQRNADLL